MNDASPRLVRLQGADLTLADPADDLRGRKVADRNDVEVGVVDDVIIDAEERRARFLEVDAGGNGELSRMRQLVPVDTITRIDDGVVQISPDRMMVAGGPGYDPSAVLERPYSAGRAHQHRTASCKPLPATAKPSRAPADPTPPAA